METTNRPSDQEKTIDAKYELHFQINYNKLDT